MLRPGADPIAWELAPHTAPDRVILATQPPGGGWRYALQLTAGWAAEELADGAECYVFVHEKDLRGAILWPCH